MMEQKAVVCYCSNNNFAIFAANTNNCTSPNTKTGTSLNTKYDAQANADMAALETASTKGDIRPFARFVVSMIKNA